MFHKKININGVDYLLAVNIVGNGDPEPGVEAAVGMLYMDENDGSLYKCARIGYDEVTGNAIGYEWQPIIAVDDIFDSSSNNPVSGVAVSAELAVRDVRIENLEYQVGDFEASLDATIALCDAYIRGDVE